MGYSIKILATASLLGICYWGSLAPAWANTGSAITGDSGSGNPDSSTFTGGFFDPPSSGGTVTESGSPFAGGRQRPKNWTCNIPPKNEEGSLRYKTIATMLTTNLAGSDTLALISGRQVQTLTGPNGEPIEQVNNQGPLFSCANRLAPLTASVPPGTTMPVTPPPVTSTPTFSDGTSGASSLAGVQPAGQALGSADSTMAAPRAKTLSLIDFFNRPVDTAFFPVPAANTIQDSLQNSLKLPSVSLVDDPVAPLDTDPQIIKSKSLRDLVTTLQGLITDKTLLGDVQGETLIDVNQFAAAIKTYNELINLLDYQELQAWSNDRYGQDITASLKKLRTVCNCGWADPATTAIASPTVVTP